MSKMQRKRIALMKENEVKINHVFGGRSTEVTVTNNLDFYVRTGNHQIGRCYPSPGKKHNFALYSCLFLGSSDITECFLDILLLNTFYYQVESENKTPGTTEMLIDVGEEFGSEGAEVPETEEDLEMDSGDEEEGEVADKKVKEVVLSGPCSTTGYFWPYCLSFADLNSVYVALLQLNAYTYQRMKRYHNECYKLVGVCNCGKKGCYHASPSVYFAKCPLGSRLRFQFVSITERMKRKYSLAKAAAKSDLGYIMICVECIKNSYSFPDGNIWQPSSCRFTVFDIVQRVMGGDLSELKKNHAFYSCKPNRFVNHLKLYHAEESWNLQNQPGGQQLLGVKQLSQKRLSHFFTNVSFSLVSPEGKSIIYQNIDIRSLRAVSVYFAEEIIRVNMNLAISQVGQMREYSSLFTKQIDKSYASPTVRREILDCYATVIHNYQLEKLRQSFCHSLSTDDTTDVMGRSITSFHAKCIGDDNTLRVFLLDYCHKTINFRDLSWKQSAQKAVEGLLLMYDFYGVKHTGCIKVSADTTSKMSGKKGGFVTLLDQLNDRFKVAFGGDRNHLLELGLKYLNDIPLVQKVIGILKIVAKLFKRRQNPKNWSILQSICKDMKVCAKTSFKKDQHGRTQAFGNLDVERSGIVPKCITAKRSEKLTRNWSGLYQALKSLLRMWFPYFEFCLRFRHKYDGKRLDEATKNQLNMVESLRKFLTLQPFYALVAFLVDFLKLKSVLELQCQKRYASLSGINATVGSVLADLPKLVRKWTCPYPGANLGKVAVVGKHDSNLFDLLNKFFAYENFLTSFPYMMKRQNSQVYHPKFIHFKDNTTESREAMEMVYFEIVDKFKKYVTETFEGRDIEFAVFDPITIRTAFNEENGVLIPERLTEMKEKVQKVIHKMNVKSRVVDSGAATFQLAKFMKVLEGMSFGGYVQSILDSQAAKAIEEENNLPILCVFIRKLLDLADQECLLDLKKVMLYCFSRMEGSVNEERIYGEAKRRMEGRWGVDVETVKSELIVFYFLKQYENLTDGINDLVTLGLHKEAMEMFFSAKKRRLGILGGSKLIGSGIGNLLTSDSLFNFWE